MRSLDYENNEALSALSSAYHPDESSDLQVNLGPGVDYCVFCYHGTEMLREDVSIHDQCYTQPN